LIDVSFCCPPIETDRLLFLPLYVRAFFLAAIAAPPLPRRHCRAAITAPPPSPQP
jgi:hypothetical protein